MTKKSPSLTQSTFWFAAAKTGGYILSVFLPLLLVRLLTRTEFGLYKQAFLITATAVQMLPFGFGLSAFYFFPRYKDQQAQTAMNVLTFNLSAGLLGLAALTVYPNILALAFGNTDLNHYAPLIGLVVMVWIFSSFLETVAASLQDVLRSTIFIIAAQLTKALFMIGAALWSASLASLLWAAVLQGVVQSCVLIWYIHKQFPNFWRQFDWPLFKTQFAYVLPLSLANLLYIFRADLPSYFVAHHFQPAEYAIYAVGISQLPLIGILHESVGAVILPRINELHHRGEFRELVRVLASATRKMSAVYWPCFAFFALMAPQFIVALYTRRYVLSVPIFVVNLLIVPGAVFPLDPVFRAYTELRYYLLKLRIGLIAVLVAALHFGIEYMGMMGAIWAVVTMIYVERVIHLWKVSRVLRPRWQDLQPVTDLPKIAAAAALAAVPTWFARHALSGMKPLWILALCGPIYAAVYAATVAALGILTPEEWASIRNRFAVVQRRVAWM